MVEVPLEELLEELLDELLVEPPECPAPPPTVVMVSCVFPKKRCVTIHTQRKFSYAIPTGVDKDTLSAL